MNYQPKMPRSALENLEAAPIYDPETSWQKPWPRVSSLLYKAPYLTFGPFLLFLTIAIVLGVGSAYFSLNRSSPFDALESGVWVAHPKAGTPTADPYSAAIYARTLRVPLGNGEGIAFYAVVDNLGKVLDPACDYIISGKTPPSRLWTLTALDNNLRLLATDAGRAHLTSQDIIWRQDGSFSINVAPFARPGNWLPSGTANGLVFALRLYDTPLTSSAGINAPVMPSIMKGACR
ncbi:DUF1214 domain-containing protein [Flexibacterium corallicola]|uniref:DUF1214 domain-containing protein n=1 Tax=Flexibacterium corallicola TaxID=3037259 RepID=UPI00286F8F12|nr:DUF1214 domain-containing protein [Pseudovibrio sp. M1P-2-3]